MALKVNVSLESGIQVEGSYARIETVTGNKDGLTIYVAYYVNAESILNNLPRFKQSIHEFFPETGDNSIRWDKQGYEYLKTLPEFDGAIDD